MVRFIVRQWRWTVKLLPIVLVASGAAGVLVGCSTLANVTKKDAPPAPTELVIPDFPTAREQYSYAASFQRAQVLSTDRKKRDAQLERIASVHARVVQLFPDDRVFTPLSELAIADCRASQDRQQEAIAAFQRVVQRHPENDYIQARGLYSIARSMDRLGQYEQAKGIYRQVMERYANSEKEIVRIIGKKAQANYLQVREQPVNARRNRRG
ncbi:MAG: tetratricopeptide repeat protein [Candidatus Sumerlaeaceae bacterium]|nr:tetratricopeptide repeat protein [Candidatus Sumerlaeaceae bacterium]